MAWSYRKRIKIAPGVRINFGKNGISTSVGPRGASLNFSSRGTYLNTSIPGTGIYSRQKIGGPSYYSTQDNQNTSGCYGCFSIGISVVLIIISFLTGLSLLYAKPNTPLDVKMFAAIVTLSSGLMGTLMIYSMYKKNRNNYEQEAEPISLDGSFFDSINEDVYHYYLFLKSLQEDNAFKATLSACDFVPSLNSLNTAILDSRIQACAFYDLLVIQKKMGHSLSLSNSESLSILLLYTYILNIDVSINKENLTNVFAQYGSDMIKSLQTIELSKNVDSPNQLLLAQLCAQYDARSERLYLNHIAKLSQFIANSDGNLSAVEIDWLSKLNESSSPNILPPKESDNDSPVIYLEQQDDLFVDVAHAIVISQISSVSMIQRRYQIGYNRAGRIMDQLEKAGIVGPPKGAHPREMLVKDVKELEKILARITNQSTPVDTPKRKYERKAARKKLDSLIGLSGVKEEINKLTSYIKIQQLREQNGLKTSQVSYHCVFTGSPGTGKTTVARIVASIYKELGILKKGHLIETDRSGLVAEYVGQTAVKTNKIIDSALDGVLFIDEAYTLAQGGSSDYGKEAIATLLKRMEDDRDRLIVIIAGYGDDIKQFVDSNPGLQSRFNRYIHFEDYNSEELKEIFLSTAKSHEYMLDAEAKSYLTEILDKVVANKDKNFGNGRYIRNLFETTLQNQAVRLASQLTPTPEDLLVIKKEDIAV